MKKGFNKKDFVLAMFILLFMAAFTGCKEQRFRWADGSWDKCEARENVVVKNDNEKIIDNGYHKPTYLYVRDLKDNTTRRVEYVNDFYSFAEPGDTLTLKMPYQFYMKYYKPEKYKHGESNLVELRETTVQDGVWLEEVLVGQTYIEDSYGMIESHQTDYHIQRKQEERAIKAKLDSIKCARNRATDSLRIEFANMSDANRIHAEKTILNSNNEILKQALSIVRAEERNKYVADSIKLAMEKEEHDRFLEQQRQERESELQRNREIRQHKRNGTLWQYIDSLNITIIDTATVIRVYNEMQLKGGLNGSYNSSSYTQPIEGQGPRGILKFGSGRGHISGGGGHSNANGGLNGNIDYSSSGAVVARDKYGYEYTIPCDPMMQVKNGDKIFLEYYGRVHNNNGYMDHVKVLNVKTK